jgi:hypothetical protein
MAIVEQLLGVKQIAIDDTIEIAPLQVLGTVVVKGNRSIYHGQNDSVTLLSQVQLMDNVSCTPAL